MVSLHQSSARPPCEDSSALVAQLIRLKTETGAGEFSFPNCSRPELETEGKYEIPAVAQVLVR